jgi:hypothetical protein
MIASSMDGSRRDATSGGVAIASLVALGALAGPRALGQGGDDPASATVIPALPYADSGTTAGYLDDSDEVCPYTGSTSPDVYYSYTPASDQQITVDLCDSLYDTKTYVYDSFLSLVDTRPAGDPACNDDFCTSPNGAPFRSFLACVNVAAGVEHFIVVDGWLGDLGSYQIDVSITDPAPCEPCVVECPAGATIEPDDCDYGNPAPNDQVNGGCNATPPAFTDIVPDETYCGTAYFDGTFRDTDWYRLDHRGAALDRPGGITYEIKGKAEFDAIYGRVDNDGVDDCTGVTSLAEFVLVGACADVSLETVRLDDGIWWFFVAPQFTDLVDCNEPAGPGDEPDDDYTMKLNALYENPPPCPWDLNGDGNVGFADLLKVLSEWGPCPMS